MKEKNMTALICSFVKSYHYKNNKYKILNDNISEKILGEKDYNSIADNMSNGIKFFNPNFQGTKEEALRFIVDNQLSPSVLGRSIFCETSLKNSIKLGCKQYLIFASGYDSYPYRNNIENLNIFEIDKNNIIDDKIKRLKSNNIDYSNINYIRCNFEDKNWIDNITNSKYQKSIISFSSLLGISYYLEKDNFSKMIENISEITCYGSSIIFDYQTYDEEKEVNINQKLAKGANETMKSKYSYNEIEKLLERNNFLIYEHLNNDKMTNIYFDKFNILNPNHKIIAPKGVNYCLAVKKYDIMN